jgi:primosomal protein N' (replication factor Y) (superfamily II helicase)
MFAEIAFPDTNHKTFTYIIPASLKSDIKPGIPVIVPLRKSYAIGVVVSVGSESTILRNQLKEIAGLLDPVYNLNKSRFELLKWLSEYYLCSIGDVFKAAYPPGLMGKPRLRVMAGLRPPEDSRQKFVYEKVKSHSSGYPYNKTKSIISGVANSLVDKLIKSGHLYLTADFKTYRPANRVVVILNDRFEIPDKLKSDSAIVRLIELTAGREDGATLVELTAAGLSRTVINRAVRAGIVSLINKTEESIITAIPRNDNDIILNPDQVSAVAAIQKAVENQTAESFLLFGVTGSGKTQVYIEAARRALELGKSILILLPEISLTPQAIRRFSEALNCPIGVWHSKISIGQRADLYQKAAKGELRCVLGVRSAVFSPIANLGLVIVDEEQDDSYKQSDPEPRYNARDVALVKARLEKAVTILGSATPSIESFYNAKTKKYVLLRLPSRYDGGCLPKPFAIDLRKAEVEQQYWPLSEPFIEKVCRAVAEDQQVILLLNRRGYAGILMCKTCGWVALCPDCRVAMTYHRPDMQMRCHFCDLTQAAPTTCPDCSGNEFDYRGIGTQKLEELLVEILGKKGIMRMDSDSTSRKGALEKIIASFELGEVPILLGTRMVAKGHHFPGVGMVGVVLADAGLHLPDFRASEKVFQLLVQAAGRAGRSARFADGGEFVVQTYDPNSGILEFAVGQDYEIFYEKEIQYRRELGYPPYGKIIRLVFSGEDDSLTMWAARQAAKECAENIKTGKVLGPAPTGVFRMGKEYHYQVLLKGKFNLGFKDWLRKLACERHPVRAKGVTIKIDVDPREMI